MFIFLLAFLCGYGFSTSVEVEQQQTIKKEDVTSSKNLNATRFHVRREFKGQIALHNFKAKAELKIKDPVMLLAEDPDGATKNSITEGSSLRQKNTDGGVGLPRAGGLLHAEGGIGVPK